MDHAIYFSLFRLDTLAHYLFSQGKLIPIKKLMTRFRSFDDLISYPQAGSFAKYLYEEYGVEIVARIWRDGEQAIEATPGKRIDELERNWLDRIQATDIIQVRYNTRD